MIKPYRIKHKASGLYYKRYDWNNLSVNGKVYYTWRSPLIHYRKGYINIIICHDNPIYDRLKDMLAKYDISKDNEKTCSRCIVSKYGNMIGRTLYRVPVSEFEKEEL